MSLALPAGPLVQALGWTLLHLVWQGALVATLLAAALALTQGRSGNLRYALSCLALGVLLALGAVTAARTYRASASQPASVSAAASTSALTPGLAFAHAPSTVARPNRIQALVRTANGVLPRIVFFWLAGVLIFSLRLMVEWLRVRRLARNGAAPAPEPWPSVARRLGVALGIRRIVRVLESAAVEIPSVVGFWRPAILIPASTMTGLTAIQLEMILAHELAHVRRHDFLVNLLQAMVETLLFYHPAVWWISRQIRIEREICCDDLAIATCGDRLEYARALVQLDTLRASDLALAASAGGGSLLERVRRIARRPRSASGPAIRAAGALAVQLWLLAAIAVPSLPSIVRSAAAPVKRAASVAVPPEPLAAVAEDVSTSAPVATRSSARLERAAHDGDDSAPPSDPDLDSDDDSSADADADVDPDPEAEARGYAEMDREIDGKPTLDDLIALRVQNVTARDVREMRALFGKVKPTDIAGMKAVGATPEFVRAMREAGLEVRTAQDAQGLAALGVTGRYIHEMRAAGFELRTAQEAQGLKAVGVTPEYVRQMREQGWNVTAQDAQSLKALDVTPEYLDEMRAAGVEIERPQEAQSLRALGVTPEFVRQLAKAGYRDLSVDDLTQLAAAGMTGSFIREMSRYRTR
jgi:beta-lactamase regulating signal transducer with metallopeptidase domain